jgi:hypothetical protein
MAGRCRRRWTARTGARALVSERNRDVVYRARRCPASARRHVSRRVCTKHHVDARSSGARRRPCLVRSGARARGVARTGPADRGGCAATAPRRGSLGPAARVARELHPSSLERAASASTRTRPRRGLRTAQSPQVELDLQRCPAPRRRGFDTDGDERPDEGRPASCVEPARTSPDRSVSSGRQRRPAPSRRGRPPIRSERRDHRCSAALAGDARIA